MLRREYGIGMYEAEEVIFDVERDLLIRKYVESQQQAGGSSGDPGDLQVVPDELRGL